MSTRVCKRCGKIFKVLSNPIGGIPTERINYQHPRSSRKICDDCKLPPTQGKHPSKKITSRIVPRNWVRKDHTKATLMDALEKRDKYISMLTRELKGLGKQVTQLVDRVAILKVKSKEARKKKKLNFSYIFV